MLQEEVIELTNRDWAIPIVFTPKKDGSLRICIEYSKLNAVFVSSSYSLSRLDKCIDFLGETRIFSTLNANLEYWKIETDTRDRSKTAFTSHYGLLKFV